MNTSPNSKQSKKKGEKGRALLKKKKETAMKASSSLNDDPDRECERDLHHLKSQIVSDILDLEHSRNLEMGRKKIKSGFRISDYMNTLRKKSSEELIAIRKRYRDHPLYAQGAKKFSSKLHTTHTSSSSD
jgi:hypothetical protein